MKKTSQITQESVQIHWHSTGWHCQLHYHLNSSKNKVWCNIAQDLSGLDRQSKYPSSGISYENRRKGDDPSVVAKKSVAK